MESSSGNINNKRSECVEQTPGRGVTIILDKPGMLSLLSLVLALCGVIGEGTTSLSSSPASWQRGWAAGGLLWAKLTF